jgi:hypothetical protein
MIRFLMSALVLCSGCSAHSAAYGPLGAESGNSQIRSIELEYSQVIALDSALQIFKRLNSKWKCYDVYMEALGRTYEVTFIPKDYVRETEESIVVGNSACGYSLTYVVSETGKVIRSYRPR